MCDLNTRCKNHSRSVCGLVIVFVLLFSTATVVASNHVLGDLNGDHCADIFSRTSANQMVVQINDCDGQFTVPNVVSLMFNTSSFAFGDLNQDGYKDLVALTDTGDVVVAIHDQAGSFLSETNIPLSLQPLEGVADIKLSYVDGDSLLDLVVVIDGLLNGRALLLYGNGSGGFTNSATIELLPMLAGGQSVHIHSVNNDAHPDLIVRDVLGQVYVLLADGLGSFDNPISVPGLLPVGNVYFADHNNDGVVDMLVLDELLGLLNLRLGNGDGSFATGTNAMVGLTPSDLIVVDINSDGNKDAVVVNLGDNSINVLLGDGMGGLVNAVGTELDQLIGSLPTLNLPVGIVSGDMNGDCRPDLAIWNELTQSYTVVLNQSGPDEADLVFCSKFESNSG